LPEASAGKKADKQSAITSAINHGVNFLIYFTCLTQNPRKNVKAAYLLISHQAAPQLMGTSFF
jgi:hypothetical protein